MNDQIFFSPDIGLNFVDNPHYPQGGNEEKVVKKVPDKQEPSPKVRKKTFLYWG